MSSKIFRDPLYNYISFERPDDSWLLDLIDCPEVQRLRRIHQLGVSHVTYPGAEHSRLNHSLGVVHLMQEAIRHLKSFSGRDAQVDRGEHPLLAAALLHDVGHGPFSHLFEPCLGVDHEEWSCKIILSPESNVNRVLRRLDRSLPGAVAALVNKDDFSQPSWQKSLLSSQLDVDRLDYLRRDSLFTGAGYGHFDWYRLLHSFELYENGDGERDLVWSEKAKYSIEEYIFARFYMYEHVYLHKTTRGFEKLLQAMWNRGKQLEQDGTPAFLVPAIGDFIKASDPTVAQFLALEEHTVLMQIQSWTTHSDRALADLSRRFLNRDGLAMIPAPSTKKMLNNRNEEFESTLRSLAENNGFTPAECYVLRDDLKTSIYKAYTPERESGEQVPNNAIRIKQDGQNGLIEISDLLPRLKPVTNRPSEQVRYYVPREIRDEAISLSRTWGT